MLCHHVPVDVVASEEICGSLTYRPFELGWESLIVAEGPSLTILFDFRYSGGEEQWDIAGELSCYGPLFHMVKGYCVEAFCIHGHLDGDTCLMSKKYTAFVDIKINSTITEDTLKLKPFLMDFKKELQDKLANLSTKHQHQYLYDELRSVEDFKCSDIHSLVEESLFHCKMDMMSIVRIEWHKLATATEDLLYPLSIKDLYLEQKLMEYAIQGILNYTLSRIGVVGVEAMSATTENEVIWPLDVPDDYNAPSATHNIPLFPNIANVSMDCKRMKLMPDQFTVVNDSIMLESWNLVVAEDHYILDNGTAYVCKEVFDNYTYHKLNWLRRDSRAMSITTVVTLSVSVCCLIVRIIMQHCVKASLHNYLLLCMSVVLCLTFLCFMFAPYTIPSIPSLCYLLAIMSHYGFLAVFFCMMAIGLHVLKKLRSKTVPDQSSFSRKSFLRYLCLCLLPPFLIVAVSVMLDFLPVDDHYKPQYVGLSPCC